MIVILAGKTVKGNVTINVEDSAARSSVEGDRASESPTSP